MSCTKLSHCLTYMVINLIKVRKILLKYKIIVITQKDTEVFYLLYDSRCVEINHIQIIFHKFSSSGYNNHSIIDKIAKNLKIAPILLLSKR